MREWEDLPIRDMHAGVFAHYVRKTDERGRVSLGFRNILAKGRDGQPSRVVYTWSQHDDA